MRTSIAQSTRWLSPFYARPKPFLSRRCLVTIPRRYYQHKPDAANIPLDKVHIPFDNLEGSTITPRERDVFQRLFQDVIKEASAKQPVPEPLKETGKSKKRGTIKVKSREELLESVSRFPEALRDIALTTAERIEQDNWEAEQKAARSQDEGVDVPTAAHLQKVEDIKLILAAELDKLKALMETADTDLALWRIVEGQLFNRVEALKLDEIVTKHNEAAKKNSKRNLKNRMLAPVEQKMQMPPEMIKDISNIGAFYPAGLLAALAMFREKFPTSTLPLSMLPQLKRIGRGSYALGASSALYHEHLQITWALTGDFSQVNAILQEMDVAGFDFTDETFSTVRRILKGWEGRVRKPRTKLESAVTRMGMITEGFDALRQWRTVIEERLETEALRTANRKISDHVVGV
jgi:hypothetical protein